MRRRATTLTVLAIVLAGTAVVIAPSAAAAPRATVLASFFPLAEAARAIGGRSVSVENLTPPGVEPHDLELTTDDRDAIEDADLVLVLGDDFQPAIERAADDRDGSTLDVLDAIGIRRADSKRDPHVWLDPVLMQRVVSAVQRALSKVDPGRSETFAARADDYRAELAALDEEYQAGLADCDRRLLVTAHEAFGWLAKRYALAQEGVAGIDPEAEPDPARIAELADLVEEEGATTVFTEDLVSPKVAETLAREAGGLRTEVLSPLEDLTDEQRERGDGYVSVMTDNLTKLREALGCR